MNDTSINMQRKSGLLLFVVFVLIMLSRGTAVAQEYRYEIGGMAGGSMYMGDANQLSLTKDWHPSVGLIFRNNLNFRWAFKADLLMGGVSYDTKNTKNVFPNNAYAYFQRNFYELGGHLEFNFFPYSDKFAYLDTSRISPYIFTGIGLTVAPGIDNTFFGVNFPLGIGVKYKLKNRLNLGLEFAVHKLFDDDFDAPYSKGFNLDNPYEIKSGLFKNKDWYNTLFISVTWEFGLRDERCTTD